MEKEIRVVLFGVGPLGVATAKGTLERKGMRIVGAVDTAKDLVGKDLGEVLNLGKTLGVTVTDDANRFSQGKKNDDHSYTHSHSQGHACAWTASKSQG